MVASEEDIRRIAAANKKSQKSDSDNDTGVWAGSKIEAVINGLSFDDADEESVFGELQHLFEAISTQKKILGVIGPGRFIEILRRENGFNLLTVEVFSSSMQQDAHEMFNYLINVMAETLLKQKKAVLAQLLKLGIEPKEEPKSGQFETWIHELFQGQLTNETKCLNCESVVDI